MTPAMDGAIALRRVPLAAIPPRFLDLAWARFFADRGRGVSIAAHLPWLATTEARDHGWLALAGDSAAGMLCVRFGTIPIGGAAVRIAGIGLVCTATAAEGRGIASALVAAAIAAARSAGADCVLLWTGKPDFYARFGFVGADTAVFGRMERAGIGEEAPPASHALAESRLASGGLFSGPRGVPPFATGIAVYSAGTAACAAIAAAATPALVASTGPPAAVARLLGGLGIAALNINDCGDGALGHALRMAGWRGDLHPVNLAMWLPLTRDCPSPERLGTEPIAMLDRF